MLKKWKVLEEKDISPSKWFPLFVHKAKLPNGKIVPDYYFSRLGDVAMVLAITKDREIVFVRQYKHGVQDIVLELPAGRIEKETPKQTAMHELGEETGFVADELILLGELYTNPSKDSSSTHAFLVNNVSIQTKQRFDETEEIEVVNIPVDQVENKIKSGEIKSADTIATLTLARVKFPELFGSYIVSKE